MFLKEKMFRKKNKRPFTLFYWISDKNNQLYWHARHDRNGEVLAQGEGYKDKRDLFTVLELLFPKQPRVPCEDPTEHI